MPSPVFLWEGAYGGAHGPRPYKVFRRAACPHAALRMDLGMVQPGRCGHRPLRRSYKRFGTERYGEVSPSLA